MPSHISRQRILERALEDVLTIATTTESETEIAQIVRELEIEAGRWVRDPELVEHGTNADRTKFMEYVLGQWRDVVDNGGAGLNVARSVSIARCAKIGIHPRKS